MLVVRFSANSLTVSLPIEASTFSGCCFSTLRSKSLVSWPHTMGTLWYCTSVPTLIGTDLEQTRIRASRSALLRAGTQAPLIGDLGLWSRPSGPSSSFCLASGQSRCS